MRYIELMQQQPLVWGLFLLYIAGTSWLAWLGHRKTSDIRSFAIGSGDLGPLVVGVTLAASIASTATFVINPGFVYVHGVSALMHLGVAAGLGITTGLIVMSVGFRTIGARTAAITLPQWIGQRYGSKGMTIFFAAINLLTVSFVVLIIGGMSILMQQTMGLSNIESLVVIVVFVFSYIFVGGTYAHAYTNTMQGLIMVVASIAIVGSGLHLFSNGVGAFLGEAAAGHPNLLKVVNPESALFSSVFSIFVCGFIIGFALVCQPHILTKALYVKSNREVWQYLGVTIVVSLFFTALLLVGLYARAMHLPESVFIDPASGLFRQDRVVAAYIGSAFGPVSLAFISVAILAAGMSTLDGILVALSSIAANDLFLRMTESNLLRNHTEEQKRKDAHRAGQVILIILGVVAFLIALHPPRLLGIFGQVGVYGIVAASTAPILLGILFPRLRRGSALAASVAGLGVHFALYGLGSWAVRTGVDLNTVVAGSPIGLLFDRTAYQLGLRNPAVPATYGIIASFVVAVPSLVLLALRGEATIVPESLDPEKARDLSA